MSDAHVGLTRVRRVVVPVAVFALLAAAVLSAGWTLEAGRQARFRGELRTVADQAVLRVQAFMDARIDALHRYRSDWRANPPVDKAVFQEKTLALQVRYPGIQAINWLDQDHVIQWITPRVGNEQALQFDLDEHPFAATALRQAEQVDNLVMSTPFELLQGGLGFVGYLRIGSAPREREGLLNIVFRADAAIEAALSTGLPDDVAFMFDDGGVGLASVGVAVEDTVAAYTELRRIPIADRTWTLRVAPSRKRVAALAGPADRLPLVIGLVLAAAIAALIAVGQRRQAQLHQSEQKYRNIVDAMNEGIWTLDAHGATRFVNRQLASMMGYRARQMVGRALDDFVVSPQWETLKTQLQSSTFNGVSPRFELDLRKSDQSTVQTVVSIKAFRDGAGRFVGAQALVSDVTERNRLEAQLVQSQKMESVGRLAGGIAHDFNNLVTGIMGACHLLELELEGQPSLLELVDDIQKCGERAAGLTHQLLAFSRQQVLRPQVLDPRDVVQESGNILRRLIGEDLDLRIELEEDLVSILIDPTQLQQVLLNLTVNAKDAMPDGGTIWIRGRTVEPAEAGELGLPSVHHVGLSVEDTGGGIPAQVRARIFEPFFTTKPFGKGTGLGLATVLGIVEQSGGRVQLESHEGVGSTFTVYLPAADAEAGRKVSSRPKVVPEPGVGHILLVEDEASVRKLIARVLQAAGYRVHVASRPREALAWVRRTEPPLNLLITDVVMPEMNGLSLADELRRMRPGLRVIFMSGYADSDRIPEALEQEVFLQKPFPVDLLTETARRELDRTDA